MVGRGNDVIDLLPPIPAKLPALLLNIVEKYRAVSKIGSLAGYCDPMSISFIIAHAGVS